MEKAIIIEYSGWIKVTKDDIKIQNDNMLDVDTTNLSEEQIVSMLKKGNCVLKSFGETYSNDAIDGEDDFTFDVEEL